MRATCLAGFALIVLGGAGAFGQGAGSVGRLPRAEVVDLRQLVDGLVGGVAGGDDVQIKWDGHFMRAGDGRVYVPFTVTLNDVAQGFDEVTMYVRVLPRGARARSGRGAGLGLNTAESPAGTDQMASGNPTAEGASFRLGLTANELLRVKPSLEGFFVARTQSTAAERLLRRSFTLAPGDYDLYVVIRERPGSGVSSRPQAAVLKRELSVPTLGGDEPTMSSVILADRVDFLAKPVPAMQEAERPYAFGVTEIVPDTDAVFDENALLSVVFFVYNLTVDKGHLPDVSVHYRFRRAGAGAEIFAELMPLRLARGHTPPVFETRAGRQLAVTQGLPLASFPPDNYTLEITVRDNLSARSVRREIRFTVREATRGRR